MPTGLSAVPTDGVTKGLPTPPGTAWRQSEDHQSPGSAGSHSLQGSPTLQHSQHSGSGTKASIGARCGQTSGMGQPAQPRGSTLPFCPSPACPFPPGGARLAPAPPSARLPGIPRRRSGRDPPRAAAYLGSGSAPALSARRPVAPAGGRGALPKPSPRGCRDSRSLRGS